ncbi:uncharacterized protein LOC119681029 isoform X2 [Teleopsis dalmanni]|uniref:uncharacterized protein LOC119681029 isoform X2 n=1 Tax=Teleopsis dalmanni TaxID=139649 RepID=UPI0018CD3F42|nr:uncharacterized protein LOC119681029 isoform X2 [Teleopsis dalmanni]
MDSFVKNNHRLETGTEDCEDSLKKGLKQLKKDSEISNLRRQLAIKEQSNDALYIENIKLRNSVASKINKTKGFIENKYMEEICSLQNKNRDLLKKLEECEKYNVELTLTLDDKNKKIHNLQDKVNSLEVKIYFIKEELKNSSQLLEHTKKRLNEINAKLINSSSAREKIRNSERENTALLTEMGYIVDSFYKAESTYQEKLNKRLKKEKGELELKYETSLNALKSLAQEKGLEFASGMIDFCKNEIDNLKTHSCRGDKTTYELEQKLFTKEHEIACYKMEVLRYECILNDRENKLKENNISYTNINRLTYNISQDQINSIQLPFVLANNNI